MRLWCAIFVTTAFLGLPQKTIADDIQFIVPQKLLGRPHKPKLDENSWVLLEILPGPGASIPVSAYFLDFSYGRNQNLCESVKRTFENEAKVISKRESRVLRSYRLCLSVSQAISQGYIQDN